jgi:arylsulfatase A-like enzyme
MISSARRRFGAFALLLLALLPLTLSGAEKPSLVVVLSVDQLRTEYLTRFRSDFGKDGFNRFLERGARFPEARQRHAWTFTCPGHASIGTGLDPRDHGIVANDWQDRVSGRKVYCVEDPGVRWVGAPPDHAAISTLPASPVLISGAFLGDRLKEKFPHARVVGVALKDRAAVPMAGRKADAAVWFERRFQRFVTSSYYPPRPALLAFNKGLPEFFAKRKLWDHSGGSAGSGKSGVFDPPELFQFKGPLPGTNPTFPHPLPDTRSVIESPFGDELTLDLARYVIQDFRLGSNPTKEPDLLFIGLSSLDYYGHRFGPDSSEVADGIARLDTELENFFGWLDRRVGSGRVLLFLTADHGVTDVPEAAREKRKLRAAASDDPESGGRLRWSYGTSSDPVSKLPPARLALEKRLAERLGYSLDPSLPIALEGAVLSFEEPSFYLNKAALERRRVPPETAKEAVRAWIREQRGVLESYTNTEVGNGLPAGAPHALAVERSFRADRSGDVFVILKPGWIFRGATGTTHGQPREEDARVPLLAWGAGVRPGTWDIRVSPLSIARTVAALFGFEAGAPDAEVLEPVLGREIGTKKVAAGK